MGRPAASPGDATSRFGDGPVPPRARLRPHEVRALREQLRAADPAARRRAAQALCPCHVRGDDADVWDRLLGLVDDPEVGVRRTVLHALIDGSPRHREAEVVHAIARLHDDPDLRLRRRARRFLAQYRRTGRVNVG